MPITWLDIVLLSVMLISGILAMIRGFMREVLSIAAWGAAAVATALLYNKLLPIAKANISSDIVATGAVIGGVFLITLLVVSIITVRISDMILDSRIGALDRTLGFLFGLGRGLIIVVVAFVFFAWLVPPAKQPEGVRNAKSRVVLENTGEWLQALLPQDMDNYLSQLLKKKKGDDQEPPPEGATPGQRSDLGATSGRPDVTGSVQNPAGYQQADRNDMRQLIDATKTR
ncbi:CvpA family protein [Rhodoplanes sp. Z2-YC6860]|uniref:CvpA family protein n=1 Tax=Rhodoplanes sp. Z2-YC6860 TaxID=674703 RepID=UPI00078DDFD1|nr:CvpA family protein [Rhodoplanes sp. Z2-YC6860]AMN42945.1 CvpA family protein [Rhodoplanes sp. Z2-YC6860]